MSNPHPVSSWKPGESGNVKGGNPRRGMSWKEVISRVMDEAPPEEWREKYGHSWAEAIIRRGNELFMQGKLPHWFISIAQYTQPNQTEINLNLTDWRTFENLGIPKDILIERLKEFAGEYKYRVIEGESRPVTNEITTGRPADDSGSPVSPERETGGEVPLVTTTKTETPSQ